MGSREQPQIGYGSVETLDTEGFWKAATDGVRNNKLQSWDSRKEDKESIKGHTKRNEGSGWARVAD